MPKFKPGDMVNVRFPHCENAKCSTCGLAEVLYRMTDGSYGNVDEIYYKIQRLNGSPAHGSTAVEIETVLEHLK